MPRPVSIAVLCTLVFAACSGEDEALTEALVVVGPRVVADHLVWVDQTTARVAWVASDTVVESTEIDRDDVRSAVFGPEHVTLLAGGDEPAAVRVAIPGGEVDVVPLSSTFDRAFLSASGRYLVAIHDARFARSSPVVAINNNEIAIVDLDSQSARRVALDTESTAPRDVVFSADESRAAIVLDADVVVVDLAADGIVRVPLKLPNGDRLAPEQVVFNADANYLFLRTSGTADVVALELLGEGSTTSGVLNFLAVPGAERLLDLAVADDPAYVLAAFRAPEGRTIAARLAADGDVSETRTVELAGQATRIALLENRTVLLHGSPDRIGSSGNAFVGGWDLEDDLVEQDALAGPTMGPAAVGAGTAFFVHAAEGGSATALTALALRREDVRLSVALRPLVLGGNVRDYAFSSADERVVVGVDILREDSGAAPLPARPYGEPNDTTGALAVVDAETLAIESVVLDDPIVVVGVLGDHLYAVHPGAFGDVTFVPRASIERGAARRVDGVLLSGLLDRTGGAR
ncbi:MAG: hypothetical protein RKU31_06265 [Deltaproteobacteria bacterium]|jgi:hypothetical protein